MSEELKGFQNIKFVVDENCSMHEITDFEVGDVVYGRPKSPYSDREKELAEEGFYIIKDAIRPCLHVIPKDADITVIDLEIGKYNRGTGQWDEGDEYTMFIQDQMNKAYERFDSLPKDKLSVGHMFRIQIADGYAFYMITAIHDDGTCDVEHRKFCPDTYFDHHFGAYRNGVPVDEAWDYVKREIAIRNIFGKKKTA